MVLLFFLQLAGMFALAKERLVNGRITVTGKGLPVAQASIRVPGSPHGTVSRPGARGSVQTTVLPEKSNPIHI